MPDLSLVILHVDNPPASAAFYADLFGQAPAEQSPTFAMIRKRKPVPTVDGLGFRQPVRPRRPCSSKAGVR